MKSSLPNLHLTDQEDVVAHRAAELRRRGVSFRVVFTFDPRGSLHVSLMEEGGVR